MNADDEGALPKSDDITRASSDLLCFVGFHERLSEGLNCTRTLGLATTGSSLPVTKTLIWKQDLLVSQQVFILNHNPSKLHPDLITRQLNTHTAGRASVHSPVNFKASPHTS
jgi:hypothetical protein